MPIVQIRMPEEENEGTAASLGKWLKKPGDSVSEHEPLLEVNTDKVTIEIAAPATGVLKEFRKAEGDAILPGDLLGTIQTGTVTNTAESTLIERAPVRAAAADAELPSDEPAADSYSPAVRRMLKQHDLDPRLIPRPARGKRLTPDDIEAYLATKRVDAEPAGQLGRLVGRKLPHTPMRRSIAEHMARSVQTAPHVTSVFEADLSQALADRAARKQASESAHIPSITAYLLHAAIQAIKLVPEVNSKWHEDYLEVFDEVNFGVATALDSGGLVVPVIRNAQSMALTELSAALQSITQRARSGKLAQADMQDGTFTLSNHGVSGSLLAAPIILPHGQAAILGAGKMQRRVIVCETGGRELFRIRPMMYVTLTVDHRALDGQRANRFLTEFVTALEKPV